MADALIGYTGFVGSNLLKARHYDHLYNSKDIHKIYGMSFDTIVCAGARAEKWKANQNPREDAENIERLLDKLYTIQVEHFVLISTIDVYDAPVGVDESSDIDTEAQSPYGYNRYWLEQECRTLFGSNLTILRLPALFGPGLKKNALYDLMHNNQTDKIAPNAQYQWYPVGLLNYDIRYTIRLRPSLFNIASEPIFMSEIRNRFFPDVEIGPENPDAPKYDVHCLYVKGGYRMGKERVLRCMEKFLSCA